MLEIQGLVVRGKGEGRALGYPTANLEYQSAQTPERGVWVCRAHVGPHEHQGLAVVGMWKLENRLPSVEVYILDFDEDLYDQTLTITLELKLRDLKVFSDMTKLLSQIEQDVMQARTYFSS